MKKVLALVLAVMMLSTMAFANGITIGSDTNPNIDIDTDGNTVHINGGMLPGSKIYVYSDGTIDAVNSDNYSITKVKYDEGKSLVEDVYFDDDNDQVIIKLADSDSLNTTKTLKMSFTLKGKGRDVDDADVQIEVKVGYQKLDSAYLLYDTDDVRFNVGYNPTPGEQAKGIFYEVKTEKGEVAAEDQVSYANWTFEPKSDADVEIDVRIYDGDKLYLYNDAKADKDILKAYSDSDADLTFLNFPNTTFNSTATVYFYKDENSFIYEEKDGKLVESNAKWSEDDGAFVLKTRTLGNYVFSDVDLDVTEDVDDTTENPDTGANDVVGIAAALGAVALVSAAAVSLKK